MHRTSHANLHLWHEDRNGHMNAPSKTKNAALHDSLCPLCRNRSAWEPQRLACELSSLRSVLREHFYPYSSALPCPRHPWAAERPRLSGQHSNYSCGDWVCLDESTCVPHTCQYTTPASMLVLIVSTLSQSIPSQGSTVRLLLRWIDMLKQMSNHQATNSSIISSIPSRTQDIFRIFSSSLQLRGLHPEFLPLGTYLPCGI